MNYSLEGRSKEAINLNACRFCLKTSRSKIQIDEKIKLKFRILMNEELVDNQKLQQTACKTCISELEQCVSVKNKIFEKQKFLLELVGLDTKQEPENEDSYQQGLNNIETVEVKTELPEQDDEIADALLFNQSFQESNYKNSDDGYRTPSPKPDEDDDDLEFELDEIGKEKCEFCDKFFERKYLRRHRRKFHASLLNDPDPKLDDIKKVNCEDCGKLLKEDYLQRHIRRFHPSKVLREKEKCPECDLMIYKDNFIRHNLRLHKHLDNQETIFICDYCGETAPKKRELVSHMRSVHQKSLLSKKCKLCNKTFPNRSILLQHVQTVHRKSKKVICDICGIELCDQKTCEDHIRAKHTGERPFKCEICPRAFFSTTAKHQHIRKVHISGPKTCHICARILVSDLALKDHIRSVHGEKNFVCGVKGCDRKYGNKFQLNKHLFKHTGLKKFVCLECQGLYGNRAGIQKHILSVHLNWSMSCQVSGCQHSFHRYDYFHTHIKRHHANLGQTEVRRLIQETKLVKIPSVLKHFKIVLSESDAEKFKKFKENCELYKSEFLGFRVRVEQGKQED